MSDTDTQELSPFLKQQSERMKVYREQDRSIEERQKLAIPAAVIEAHQPDVVTRHELETDRVDHRVIESLPTPQRIQPAKPIEKDELLSMIAELRNEIATEQDKFEQKDAIDHDRTTRRLQLVSKIAFLEQELASYKASLQALIDEGSVREGWIAAAKRAEGRITSIATGAYNFLLEKLSQDKHEASYKELQDRAPLLAESVRFSADRSGIRSLTQGSFQRLHRTPDEQIFNAAVEQTLDRVTAAADKLEATLSK